MMTLGRARNRRKEPPRRRPWGLYVGGALVTCALLLAAYSVHWMLDPHNMPIRSVRVDGEFRHLSADRLHRVVAAEATGGFFNVNVQDIRAAVMADPWVRDVAVRRIWPHQLHVTVIEQRAIAYWRDDSLLNDRGQAFHAPAGTFPHGLVQLIGPSGTERVVLNRYRELANWFRPLGLRVGRVELTDRRAWSFSIEGGFHVVVGRSDFEGRVKRLLVTLPRVADRLQQIEVIDLRYTNGFAIRPSGAADNDAG
jgi:cell division protein FtsQ